MSSAVLPANVCDDGMSETDGTESGAVQNFYKEESYIMKILFYDTQSYDKESFSREAKKYPGVEMEFLKTSLAPRTAALAKGHDAVCAFVNSDVGTGTVEELHKAGVRLILLRCAGFNNVDLPLAQKYGIEVRRVPGYSPEAVAEHAMALALTVNRRMHKAYTKVRENDFSLNGLMGV